MASKAIDFEPETCYLTYAKHEPALWIKPGTVVRIPTVDAAGKDQTGERLPAERFEQRDDTDLFLANPLSGAFCVEGAEPGDCLVCEIREIELTRETAWSRNVPTQVFFAGEGPAVWRHLMPTDPPREYSWRIGDNGKTATLAVPKSRAKEVTIPLHPFLGCIGVAPPYGRVEPATTPGEYGGNMDAIETAVGATVYLPVFVRGGYLYVGDVHAAQGDGEICLTALEISARVTMRLDLIKGKRIGWPRVETDDYIMAIGNAKPLADAFGIAYRQLVQWLIDDYGFDPNDAIQLVSQACRVRIGNVVDPRYTVTAKFPKALLP